MQNKIQWSDKPKSEADINDEKALLDQIDKSNQDYVLGKENFNRAFPSDVKDLRQLQNFRKTRTFSYKRDFKWAHNEYNNLNNEPERYAIQNIILEEFEPEAIFDIQKIIDAAAQGAVPKLLNFASNVTGASTGISLVAQGEKQAMYAQLKQEALSNDSASLLKLPIEMLERYFTGTFNNTYELPFFNDNYIAADTTSNWSTGGSERALGTELSRVMKENLTIDFPTTPIWTLGDHKGDNFTFNFYLINDSVDSLKKNFKFMHAFISGAFWLQMDIMQQPPNVYRVTVPGRFMKIFCAMGVKATNIGKLRICGQEFSQSIGYSAITSTTLMPEAWKIEITITDLTPNNFNVHMNYLINGSSIVKTGETRERILGTGVAAKSLIKNTAIGGSGLKVGQVLTGLNVAEELTRGNE